MGMGAMDGANGGAFSHDAHAGMPGMDQDSGPGAAMIHGAMDHSMRDMSKLPPGANGVGVDMVAPMPVDRMDFPGLGLDTVSHRVLRYTRSEEHTSELQSLMRISYAVFCLKKKK